MKNLELLMKRTGKNQRETGELLGISQVHVSRLLSGKDKPSKALEMSIERQLTTRIEGLPVDPRSRALLEIFESLPEESKKDILCYVEKEKRLADIMKDDEKELAA